MDENERIQWFPGWVKWRGGKWQFAGWISKESPDIYVKTRQRGPLPGQEWQWEVYNEGWVCWTREAKLSIPAFINQVSLDEQTQGVQQQIRDTQELTTRLLLRAQELHARDKVKLQAVQGLKDVLNFLQLAEVKLVAMQEGRNG